MLIHDHISRQATNRNNTMLRNALFQTGQKIQRETMKAMRELEVNPSHQTLITLVEKRGQLEGYVKTRKSLAPSIAGDVALNQQKGVLYKAQQAIDLFLKTPE